MIIQIIGWYCIAHAALGEIALIASVIQNDATKDARASVNFMNIGWLAIAAWCFK